MRTGRPQKAQHIARTGDQRGGWPTKPRPIPPAPQGRINITDPDSRSVKTATGFLQGYTAQAVATEEQIVIAADVICGGNERHRLAPMITDACDELAAAGIQSRMATHHRHPQPPQALAPRPEPATRLTATGRRLSRRSTPTTPSPHHAHLRDSLHAERM